jgi:hypothetical protein
MESLSATIIGDPMRGIAAATPLRNAGLRVYVPLAGKTRTLIKQAAADEAEYIAIIHDDQMVTIRCRLSGLKQVASLNAASSVIAECLSYDDRCDYRKCAVIYAGCC